MLAVLVLTFILGSQSAPQSCPRICPENLALVCGSDGISYSNECELSRADCQSTSGRITQAYTGECRGCSPVSCDNNNCGPGQDCTIVQPEGFVGLGQQPCPEVKCVKRECPDQCPFNYEPMCGTDGVTYGNTCQMEAANCEAGGTILLAHPGECKTDDARCPPVTCDNNNCGPDQDCKILEPHGSFGEHPCPEVTCVKRECPDQCPFNHEPVCGTDGVTYPNTCALGVASCEAGGTIIQAHPGECTNSGCRAVTCDNNNCGPDQDCKIFENPGHQACPELTCVKRECPDQCPFNYEPVCGSDGVTYPNTCAFEVANCQAGGTILLAPPEECTTGGSGNAKTSGGRGGDCPSWRLVC